MLFSCSLTELLSVKLIYFILAEEVKPRSELEERFAKMHDKSKSPISLKPKPKVAPPVAQKPAQTISPSVQFSPPTTIPLKPSIKNDQGTPIQCQRVEPVQMKVKLFDDGDFVEDEVQPQSVKKNFAEGPLTFDSTLPFSSESESEEEKEPLVDEVVSVEKKESPEAVNLDKILAVESCQKSSFESSSDDESDHVYERRVTPGPSEDGVLPESIQTRVADLLLTSDEEEQGEKKAGSSSDSLSEEDYYEELHHEPRKKEHAPSEASSEERYLTPDDLICRKEKDDGRYLTPDVVKKAKNDEVESDESSSSRSSGEEDEDGAEVATLKRDPSVRGAKPIAPKIIVPLEDLSCKDGDDVFFEVEFVASPKPDVLWHLDGNLIRHSEDFEILIDSTSSSLFIQEAFPDDSGQITVTIKNSQGEASCSACLTIKGRVCVSVF